ncbi:hypothetical protein EPUS_09443 [Endocarpon pusillum Z07020]|uniref:Uncharacterized protein n=1 Tax=Endocarpon pusillum (strain Z07020 / HMAS-L-300199) TaxID=1263415 RepID=U1GAG2_ENDPU|nr:uncharacterized protein EPUS_09443 [Endocarpon pusillum Z07020]ERF68651.1 hypothetical protein EPUS_09443 [Endocarpon pusillum Z07020]
MIRSLPRHSTCHHSIQQDDPRRGPTRPVCFACFQLIKDQAVISIERRLFSAISQGDFSTTERYYTALELAFATGRFEALELALWTMARDCVFAHPMLFMVVDIEFLVVSTMRMLLDESMFEYTEEDARAFAEGRALTLEMEATSLNAHRRQSTASDSGSIQLQLSDGTPDNNDLEVNNLVADLGTMSVDEDNTAWSG